ncbi:unnamed protein product [Allacma fusca]|uniref:CUB domain-containing protein n=1 Tax=Allacma fusca TaxID=39272 RepID=A0A8J2NII3_9HEXA|nr:unnamed protein product [Allacma fusca]
MFHLFALVPLNVLLLDFISLATTCKISEFKCESGDCVDLDRYCNGVTECPDSSDEPRHCTPCNRTYYGIKSSTYNLQLHNSQATKSSFSCSLTFIAAGGPNGDLIQLKFNSIFLSKISPQQEISNCRRTKLIIQEPDRQIYSEFCHYSFINKPYFSETNRLILTFVSTELNNQLNFDFKLTFKFIGKDEASVRYGNGVFRGDLLPGTPCSLLFNNCYKEK